MKCSLYDPIVMVALVCVRLRLAAGDAGYLNLLQQGFEIHGPQDTNMSKYNVPAAMLLPQAMPETSVHRAGGAFTRASGDLQDSRVKRASWAFFWHRALWRGYLFPYGFACLSITMIVSCGFMLPRVNKFTQISSKQFHDRIYFTALFSVLLAIVLWVWCLVALFVGLREHVQFIHIPKNAGTSIENAGVDAGIYWGASNYRFHGYQAMPDGSTCSRQHVPPALLTEYRDFYDTTTFCVIRHPFERAVSEYVFLLDEEVQRAAAWDSKPWGQSYEEEYDNGLYDYPACSSEGLNHFVQTTLAHYQAGKKYIDDCHHVAQVDYIWDSSSGKQTCGHIIRLEDLGASFRALMRRFGYLVTLPAEHHLSTNHCPGVSVDMLTDESKLLLKQVYADDLKLLGYTPH